MQYDFVQSLSYFYIFQIDAMSTFANTDSKKTQSVIILISGPTGVGKTLAVSHLRAHIPGLQSLVSFTTREAREGERDGQSYFFVSREKFEALVQNNQIFEKTEYAGHLYGTPSLFLEKKGFYISDVDLRGVDAFLERRKACKGCHFVFIELWNDAEVVFERLAQRDKNAMLLLRRKNLVNEYLLKRPCATFDLSLKFGDAQLGLRVLSEYVSLVLDVFRTK